MKKLSKELQKQRDDAAFELESAAEEFNKVRDSYNDVITLENEKLREAAEILEAAIEQAKQWANVDAAGEIREYMSERSEKWLESPRGQAYEEWASSYEQFEIESPHFETPEPIEEYDVKENPFEDLQDEFAG